MSREPALAIADNPEAKRFEGRVDGELVGVVEYIPLPGKVIATHTEVPKAHEGKGIASQLVAGVIDHLRAEGRLLQATCPYVSSWLRRHPEAWDVVDPNTPS